MFTPFLTESDTTSFVDLQVTSYQCHDEPTKLEVILVDSGGIATVKYNQVYQIEDCFCQETAQGLFCSVFDLEPADGTWEVDAVSLFMSLCDNLVATFHPPPSESREPFSKYQTDYSVSLRCIRDDKVCDVGSLLVQNAMAKPKTNQRELNVSADSATSAVKSSISIKDIAKMNVAHEAPAGKKLHSTSITLDQSFILETDVDNERVVRPVDELLMQQFFDSLTITPKQPDRSLDSETRSFVTAASFNPRVSASLTLDENT